MQFIYVTHIVTGRRGDLTLWTPAEFQDDFILINVITELPAPFYYLHDTVAENG
jgi:hypothetical protein